MKQRSAILVIISCLMLCPQSWPAEETVPEKAEAVEKTDTAGETVSAVQQRSIIYDSVMARPLSGRELPIGYMPQPFNHTLEPLGFRAQPPGYNTPPRNYREKEPNRLEPTRNFRDVPPDFIERDALPINNPSEKLRIDAETHYHANKDETLRIPNEEHPSANNDPDLRISQSQ